MLTITITHTLTHAHLQHAACSTPRVRSRRNWQFQINAPKPEAEARAGAAASSLNGLLRPGLARSGLVWSGFACPGRSAIVPKMGLQLEFAFSQATHSYNNQKRLQLRAATPSLIVAQVAIAAASSRSSCTRRCEQLESFNATKLKSFSNES